MKGPGFETSWEQNFFSFHLFSILLIRVAIAALLWSTSLKWFSSGHGFDNVLLEQTDEELSKQAVNEDYEMCEAQFIHAF